METDIVQLDLVLDLRQFRPFNSFRFLKFD